MEELRLGGGGGKPPIPSPARKPVLSRHASFARGPLNNTKSETERIFERIDAEFIPVVRSGGWADIGSRSAMEDVYICCDNFLEDFGPDSCEEGPSSFYGVFDGHGGKHAADFVCSNLPRFIVEGDGFPGEIEKAVSSAFLQTDAAFADACSVNSSLASGTTALAALITGRSLLVANVGDCRAVLCCRGKAIEMSRDHKPSCNREKTRIEASGGYLCSEFVESSRVELEELSRHVDT